MEGKVSSLNAAAAGTILLYEALRQRRRDAAPPGTRTPRPEQAAATMPELGRDTRDEGDRREELDAAEVTADAVLEDEPAVEEEAPTEQRASRDGEAIPIEADEADVAEEPAPAVAEKPKRKTTTARKRTTKKAAEE